MQQQLRKLSFKAFKSFFFFQVPFREAHGLSGAAVQAAENKGCPLNELTVDDLKEVRCV